MKILMASTAALLVLTSAAGVYAQTAGPYYGNTIHQSVGGRDSRGFPKYYQRHYASPRVPADAYAAAEPRPGARATQQFTNNEQFTNEERRSFKRIDQR